MTDWQHLSARASLAAHRLVGWIYWDPVAIQKFAALGIPDGTGYYISSRSAPLAAAGSQAVAAAFYSIHPGFIEICLNMASGATTWEQVVDARNAEVGEGLRTYAPEICDGLTDLGPELWAAADDLPLSGRVLFAAHREWARPTDRLVSAWLAVNCIREWRGDTHWAVLAAEDISGTQAGILHNAFLNYPADWIPRSRGADDNALSTAWAELEARGLAENRTVAAAGLALRQDIEDRTDRLAERAWRQLGAATTEQFLALIEPIGDRMLARIDDTAGTEWMPAARQRRD